MKKDNLHYLIDFFSLLLIICVCFYGIYYFRYQVDRQIAITFALGVLYVAWGAYHHLNTDKFSFKVILEYFAVSVLVVTILTVLLLGV